MSITNLILTHKSTFMLKPYESNAFILILILLFDIYAVFPAYMQANCVHFYLYIHVEHVRLHIQTHIQACPRACKIQSRICVIWDEAWFFFIMHECSFRAYNSKALLKHAMTFCSCADRIQLWYSSRYAREYVSHNIPATCVQSMQCNRVSFHCSCYQTHTLTYSYGTRGTRFFAFMKHSFLMWSCEHIARLI